MGEAEVGHGAGDGSYIEGIARGDEHDIQGLDLGGLGLSRQEMIVVGQQEGGVMRDELLHCDYR
jgi:hypothetical protein